MNFNLIANGFFLITFAVWIVTAFGTKRTVFKEKAGNRKLFLILLIIAVSLIFRKHEWGDYMHLQIIPRTYFFGMIGLIITGSGCLFAIWARFSLGKNWSGIVTLKEDHQLITTGPYAITRNPIYSGLLLAFTGKAIITGEARSLVVLIILTLGLLYKINREEQLLTTHFGQAFTDYKRRTKKLIPFIF